MKSTRNIERTTDAYGDDIVRVPLANFAGYAVVDAEDFDRMLAAGLSPNWFANLNGENGRLYVKTQVPHDRPRTVARFVAGAGDNESVRYRDGDTFNLRRENLIVYRGGRVRYGSEELLQRLERFTEMQRGQSDDDSTSGEGAPAAPRGPLNGGPTGKPAEAPMATAAPEMLTANFRQPL